MRDFFDQTTRHMQDRFNETFGKLIVCNINQRQRIMLSIIALGRLEKKIIAAENRHAAQADIKRFMRTCKYLTKQFNAVEQQFNQSKERRDHGNNTKHIAESSM
jgi:hypothetical protein